jgi:Ca2+-binding RTX toxin-like protein
MTSTTGAQVSLGSVGYGAALNLQNLKNLFDNDVSTIGKSPNLNFTLDTVPTGTGQATIKATIIQGNNATRSGTESEMSVEVTVAYFGDGTSATLTMPAGGTGAVSYTTAAGVSATYTVTNVDADAFSITAANAVTGDAAVLAVKMGALYDVFVNSDLGAPDMLRAGDYSIALETTLPLQNYANETVTKFTGLLKLEDGNTKDSIVGTDGADTITGTSAAEVIISGAGKDTIATNGGGDIIILAAGTGSTVLANSNTVSDFTDGTDTFALDSSLTLAAAFAELTVAADATTAADTVISKGTEYLMTVTGVAYGYIDIADFVLTSDIA